MTEGPDLHYDPKSVVGPLDRSEIERFETWLGAIGYSDVRFDEEYIHHLDQFHGGVPAKRYFRTAMGTEQGIKRFLHFCRMDPADPLWQYSVPATWSLLSDRMGMYLIPFAELYAGDMLCFDFERSGPPRVVAWFHERSHSDCEPYTEPVAENFHALLGMLTDTC